MKGASNLEHYSRRLRPDHLDEIYAEWAQVACAGGAGAGRDRAGGLRWRAGWPGARALGAGDHRSLRSIRPATGAWLCRYGILGKGTAWRDPGAGTPTCLLFAR